MPEPLAPGVHVEEVSFRAKAIEGVDTGTAAFIGAAERGPLAPRRVASVAEFARWFGATSPTGTYLADAVAGYFVNGGDRLVVCRVTGAQATTAHAAFGGCAATAVGPGAWGDRVWVRVDPEPAAVRLRTAYWATLPPSGLFDPFDAANAALRAAHPPAVEEDFRALTPQQFVDAAPASVLVRLTVGAAVTLPAAGSRALAGGSDGTSPPGADDVEGVPSGARGEPQGLAALGDAAFDDVALVYAPAADEDSGRRVIAHCAAQRHRFAVVDGPADAAALARFDPRVAFADTAYAACYVPWLRITDGRADAAGATRLVPPGGHVAGVYARSDRERGVYKAPANELVQGIVGLAVEADRAVQEQLGPRGVNLIRSFAGRGTRVWGARTLSTDREWTYVNVRRYLSFLEHSIDRGTQWAVFEPNGETLWHTVVALVSDFLHAEWRKGALAGATPAQAFVVRCDRSTMTQADLDSGRLICLVGVAPLKPAEFVLFRIGQMAQATAPR
jgi:phage tail sheath protein FI